MNKIYLYIIFLILFSCDKKKDTLSSIDQEENIEINYEVNLEGTGKYQLVIFQDSIESLSIGDQIGVFDFNGVIESCFSDTISSCTTPQYGEVLVGTGVWTGSQLEISAIMSVDLYNFSGPVLNGAVDGNSVMLKIYRASENMEYNATATWSTGSGTFGDLILAASALIIY